MSLPRNIRNPRRLATTAAQLFAVFWLAVGMHATHQLFHGHEHGHEAGTAAACCAERSTDAAETSVLEAPCPVCLLTALGGKAGIVVSSPVWLPSLPHAGLRAIAACLLRTHFPSRRWARGPPALS